MLSRIEISNFKAIGETPLILDNLASVNYLVGPNGCGKSSVMETLNSDFLSTIQLVDFTFKIDKDTINKNHLNKNDNNLKMDKMLEDFRISFRDNVLEISKNNYTDAKINEIYGNFKNSYEFNGYYSAFYDTFLKMINPNNISKSFFTYNKFQNLEIRNSTLLEFTKKIDSEEKMKKAMEFYNTLPEYQNNEIKDISPNLKQELRLYLDNHQTHFIKDLATGYQNLFTLFYQIKNNLKKDRFNLCLIEEPENGLHPEFQKKLPKIFEDLSKDYFVSFFITTHSPFIISESGKFTETQKVYLIDKGRCSKSNGFFGIKAIGKAAKMLGAGLKDTTENAQDQFVNKNTKIIYCESSNKGCSDAEIYNLIFKDIEQYILFISCGSCDQVATQFEIQSELNEISKRKVEIIGLIDKDDKNDELEEFKDLKKLDRRELENYLLDWEVAKHLFKIDLSEDAYYEKLGTDKMNFYDFDVKNLIFENQALRQEIFKKCSSHSLRKDLAQIIRENTESEVYKQLHNCIFK